MPEPSTFSQTLIGMQREIDDLKRRLQANIPRGAGGGGYTGGDLYVDGKLEIPQDSPSMGNQEILDAIFGWAMSMLTGTASAGQKNIPVADTEKFVVGNVVTITDTSHSESGVLASKSSTVLTLEDNLTYTYTVAASGFVKSWVPTNFPAVTRPLRFKDNTTGQFLNHFLITSSDNYDAPLHTFDQGMLVKKDLAVGGFFGAQQGMLWLGHGLNSPSDEPKIVLGHTSDKLLTANASSGQKNVVVSVAAVFHTGIPVVIGDNSNSETAIIASVNTVTNTLTMQQNLTYSYTTAASAHVYEPYDTVWLTKSDGATLAKLRMEEIRVNSIKKADGSPFPFGSVSVITDTGCVAGAGGVTINHFVSITGDDTVSLSTRTNAVSAYGIAAATATVGNPAEVTTFGRAQVIAGETLVAGDRVVPDDDAHAIKFNSITPALTALTLAAEASHTHSVGSHSHAYGTLAATAVGNHTHACDSGTGGSDSNASALTAIATSATHTHQCDSGTGGSDSNASAVQSINTSATHTHQCDSGTGGSDSNLNATYVTFQSCPSGHTNCQVSGHAHYSFATSTHTHAIYFTSNADGAHSHTTGTASFATSTHTHAIYFTSNADGAHNHTPTAASFATSTHTHAIYFTTNADGGHGHAISGDTAASSGNTGAGASHNHALVSSTIASIATGEVCYKVLIGATTGNLCTVYVR